MTSGQDRPEPAIPPVTEDSFPPTAEHQPGRRLPMGLIVLLVVVLTVVLTTVVVLSTSDSLALPWQQGSQDSPHSLISVSTRTPTPGRTRTSRPTRTRIVVAPPTRRPTLTATSTPARLSPPTLTPSAVAAAGTQPTPGTTTPTSDAETGPTESLASATETSTPQPSRRPWVPAPVLKEPPVDAQMPPDRVVRFKFVWSRELQANERVMLHIRSIEHAGEFAWGASRQDILNGGGKIYPVPGGVLYEINAGFGSVPSGKAVWKVAIVLDTLTVKKQISPWSEERPIVRRGP